jgi:hypothetical protein
MHQIDQRAGTGWRRLGAKSHTCPDAGEVGRRAAIVWLQRSLELAGEQPGAIDGVLGSRTAAAFYSYALKQRTQDDPIEVTLRRLQGSLSELTAASLSDPVTPDQRIPSTAREGAWPGYFGVGSTAADVILVQGQPNKVKGTTWSYSRSTVEFAAGHVVRWTVVDRTLYAVH